MSHCAMREEKPGIKISNAGYHFTYLGNAEAVKTKVESFSHQEFNVPVVKDNIEWSIRNAIATGRDLYGRPRKFEVVGIETLPKYVQDNPEKFSKFIYKEN
jgi:beta-1,4-mannosyl-glycoprotein beta-1,4-N-acetylglucosaminyltransferase